MKVLSVSHYFTPHVGGLEIVAQNLANSLVQAGHTVTVVTCAASGEQSGMTLESGKHVYRVRALNVSDRLFSIPFPIGGIGLMRALWREISKSDVVHIHDVFYQTSWLAFVFAKLLGKPLILTQHVGIVQHSCKPVMWIQKIVYATFGIMIFGYARTIISYNPHVRDFLLSRGVSSSKVLLVRNGIQTSVFHPHANFDRVTERRKRGLPEHKPLVLFVGRFVPKKGYDLLYRARDEAYDIVYAGSGTLPSDIVHTPGIHNLGALSQEELVAVYQLVDVFVFPAKGEIFTLVMQEAMASGLPVIASDEAGYSEYDIDRKLLRFIKRDTENIREAITAILSDAGLRQRMSEYSLHLAHTMFSWGANVQPVMDTFSSVCTPNILVTTSWDDGHVLDTRLAQLLQMYGIAGTFYIAPHNSEFKQTERLSENATRELDRHFEIGAHSMTHRHLSTLSPEDARNEIQSSKDYLERLLHHPVQSFCYPAGKYLPVHTRQVAEAGFLYARTVSRFSFVYTDNQFEEPTSVHTYNHWLDAWNVLKFVRFNPITFATLYMHWDLQAMRMFDYVEKHGGVFHLWGHSWEIEAHNDWERLERVLAYISKKPHVRYVTNGELHTYA